MAKRAISLLSARALALVLVTGAGPAQSPPSGPQQSIAVEKDRTLTVMTRNVYYGRDAELARAASARSFGEFLVATSALKPLRDEGRKRVPKPRCRRSISPV